MQTDIGKLTSDWNDIDGIVLYGVGTVAKICEKLFDKVDITITNVIDQDISKQINYGMVWLLNLLKNHGKK